MSSTLIRALATGVAVLAGSACSSSSSAPSQASSTSSGGTAATPIGTSGRGGGSGVAGGSNSVGGSLVNAAGALAAGGQPSGSGGGATAGATTGGGQGASGGTGGSNAGSGGSNAGGSNAGGAAQAGAGGADPFVLSWQDDFNTLNAATWQLENFTYDGNQATFAPQNASVQNGVLTIALSNAASGAAKPYLGVEMRSTKTLTYGKVSARMRFATGSGVVSGLVLFYTPFPNCDWNEIDIEHLGNSSNTSQFNAMVYLGTQVPNCTASVTPTQDPLVTNLGFNAESDYHLYDIEWTPTSIKYIGDGVVLRTWTNNIALMKRPLTVLLTIWASNVASWAGALTPTSAPTSADIDWIKVYDWKG